MALATESDTQSTQPVLEEEVAAASPWKAPRPKDWALEVTSPVSEAPLEVAEEMELMPAAARDPARDWARPSLVSAEEATRDCACTRPVDSPRAREPALPSSVPAEEATVALPWKIPRE